MQHIRLKFFFYFFLTQEMQYGSMYQSSQYNSVHSSEYDEISPSNITDLTSEEGLKFLLFFLQVTQIYSKAYKNRKTLESYDEELALKYKEFDYFLLKIIALDNKEIVSLQELFELDKKINIEEIKQRVLQLEQSKNIHYLNIKKKITKNLHINIKDLFMPSYYDNNTSIALIHTLLVQGLLDYIMIQEENNPLSSSSFENEKGGIPKEIYLKVFTNFNNVRGILFEAVKNNTLDTLQHNPAFRYSIGIILQFLAFIQNSNNNFNNYILLHHNNIQPNITDVADFTKTWHNSSIGQNLLPLIKEVKSISNILQEINQQTTIDELKYSNMQEQIDKFIKEIVDFNKSQSGGFNVMFSIINYKLFRKRLTSEEKIKSQIPSFINLQNSVKIILNNEQESSMQLDQVMNAIYTNLNIKSKIKSNYLIKILATNLILVEKMIKYENIKKADLNWDIILKATDSKKNKPSELPLAYVKTNELWNGQRLYNKAPLIVHLEAKKMKLFPNKKDNFISQAEEDLVQMQQDTYVIIKENILTKINELEAKINELEAKMPQIELLNDKDLEEIASTIQHLNKNIKQHELKEFETQMMEIIEQYTYITETKMWNELNSEFNIKAKNINIESLREYYNMLQQMEMENKNNENYKKLVKKVHETISQMEKHKKIHDMYLTQKNNILLAYQEVEKQINVLNSTPNSLEEVNSGMNSLKNFNLTLNKLIDAINVMINSHLNITPLVHTPFIHILNNDKLEINNIKNTIEKTNIEIEKKQLELERKKQDLQKQQELKQKELEIKRKQTEEQKQQQELERKKQELEKKQAEEQKQQLELEKQQLERQKLEKHKKQAEEHKKQQLELEIKKQELAKQKATAVPQEDISEKKIAFSRVSNVNSPIISPSYTPSYNYRSSAPSGGNYSPSKDISPSKPPVPNNAPSTPNNNNNDSNKNNTGKKVLGTAVVGGMVYTLLPNMGLGNKNSTKMESSPESQEEEV